MPDIGRISSTRFRSAGCLLLAAIAHAALARGAELPEPTFPPSPRLAVTRDELAARRSSADFAKLRAAAVAAAARRLDPPVALPDGPGSWIFYYACPDDGTSLRMITLDEHECPTCKQRYRDERTIAAYRCAMHYELERAAEELGWAYAYTDDERYAAGVKRILLHLAAAYEHYPARLDRWGRRGLLAPLGGRRYVQSLDEAVGAVRLAKSYDLTRGAACWSDEERRAVEEKLFRATADTLLVFNQGINNHQTWYNAGLMVIASVLGDEALVRRTLTMRGGFFDQLQRSLGDDGLWYEGTMAYQNYALQAMVEIVEAGRRLGLPLSDEPRFKKLLASSLEVAYPDGSYPAINDSDPGSMRSFQWSYRWAWDVYREPRFAQAAAWGKPELLHELLGPDAQPRSPLTTRSLDLSDAGLTILRVGQPPDQTCVFFDYGQHGGGHGHFDKLNITLFAAGREWLFDTGRISYSHKEYKTWVKHTVAHNTVVLAGKSQNATTGQLIWFQTGQGYAACAGESRGAYPGAVLRRYLLLGDKLLIDVFDVEAAKPTTIDWLAHAVCQPVAPAASLDERNPSQPVALEGESLGSDEGYQHLTEVRRWAVAGTTRWDFAAGPDAKAKRLRVWVPAAEGETFYTAIGIGSNTSQKAPCLVRRRTAQRVRFITVYDLSGTGDHVTAVAPQEGETQVGPTPSLTVTTAAGPWHVEFDEQGVRVSH